MKVLESFSDFVKESPDTLSQGIAMTGREDEEEMFALDGSEDMPDDASHMLSEELSDDLTDELSEEIRNYLAREMTGETEEDPDSEPDDSPEESFEDPFCLEREGDTLPPDVVEEEMPDTLGENYSISNDLRGRARKNGESVDKDSRFHAPVVFLLLLLLIVSCTAALLFMGHKAYVSLSEELPITLQGISESENRVTLFLKEFRTTLLQKMEEKDQENHGHRQRLEQEISEIQQRLDAMQEQLSSMGLDPAKESVNKKEPTVQEENRGSLPEAEVEAEVSDHTVKESENKAVQKEEAKTPTPPLSPIKHKRAVKRKEKIVKTIKEAGEGGSSCFKEYHAHDNDTLWDIARRVYGAGKWYPVLLLHNSELSIYNIDSTSKVRYLCRTSRVSALYKQRFFQKRVGKTVGLFWRFTVRQGDTIADLQKRYCPPSIRKEQCIPLEKLPEPGKDILIRLE